jgi:hypothetical protein
MLLAPAGTAPAEIAQLLSRRYDRFDVEPEVNAAFPQGIPLSPGCIR